MLLRPESHRERWMVSYLDVVTLLLVFFVAAAARTASLPAKAAPKPLPPPPPPAKVVVDPVKTAREKMKQDLEALGFDVTDEARGLVVSLPQSVLFASGDDRIGDAALPFVDRIAAALRIVPNHVILIGHADSVPIHNRRFNSNWELSIARGMRLLELLTTNYGIDERRLAVSGDSSNRPVQTNETSEGRANNRRVELVILDEAAAAR